jgi:hypothetical protein
MSSVRSLASDFAHSSSISADYDARAIEFQSQTLVMSSNRGDIINLR